MILTDGSHLMALTPIEDHIKQGWTWFQDRESRRQGTTTEVPHHRGHYVKKNGGCYEGTAR